MMAAQWKKHNHLKNAYQILVGPAMVELHHHITSGPFSWFMSCDRLGISAWDLNTDDVESAKRLAIERIGARAHSRASQMICIETACREILADTAGETEKPE